MHQTNKDFEKYFRIEADDVRNIYTHAAVGTNIALKKEIIILTKNEKK